MATMFLWRNPRRRRIQQKSILNEVQIQQSTLIHANPTNLRMPFVFFKCGRYMASMFLRRYPRPSSEQSIEDGLYSGLRLGQSINTKRKNLRLPPGGANRAPAIPAESRLYQRDFQCRFRKLTRLMLSPTEIVRPPFHSVSGPTIPFGSV